MNLNLHNTGRKGIFFLIIAMSALLYLRFGNILSGDLIETWGDGFKTYTNIIYHAKYDKTYSHFEGMNYPYGEHVIPGGVQSFWSNPIKFIHSNITPFAHYTPYIINWALLITQVLAALFLFLIFRRLKVPDWYGILISMGIILLAPQLDRMASHFGLAHHAVLPCLFYLLMLWNDRPTIGKSLLIALVITLFSLIHFYYFAIMGATVGLFMLLRLWGNFSKPNTVKTLFHILISVVLPLAIFSIWLALTDHVDDRPIKPWGFFFARAHPASIFALDRMPFYAWVHKNVMPLHKMASEGHAYVGMVTTLFCLIIVLKWFFGRFKKSFLPTFLPEQKFLYPLFQGSILLLLFSFALPFSLHESLRPLVDLLGPLRLFRAIGRFAWVFYFASCIIAFASVYHWAATRKNKGLTYFVLGLSLVTLFYEAYTFSHTKKVPSQQVKEWKTGQTYPEITSVKFEDYQAIIPLPYFNIGFDGLGVNDGGYILQKSLTLSSQTGLPITGAMLTRSSRSQTYNQFQLVTEGYEVPQILEDLPNEKPLLVMVYTRMGEELEDKYGFLYKDLDILWEGEAIALYELPIEELRRRPVERKEHLEYKFMLRGQDLSKISEVDSTNTACFHHKWNEEQGIIPKAEWMTVYDDKLPCDTLKNATIRYWQFIDEHNAMETHWHIREFDKNGNQIKHYAEKAANILKMINADGWALFEIKIELADIGNRLDLRVRNSNVQSGSLIMENFLIANDWWKNGELVPHF